MSEYQYDDISKFWESEKQDEVLGDLEDLQLSKMIEYLSNIRLRFAETHANEDIQAEIYEQEAINLEFMLRDLLILRRNKILQAAVKQEEPSGDMTISEEEFYNRVFRAFSGHDEFVENTITGSPSATVKLSNSDTSATEEAIDDDDTHQLDYVMVRFLQPIEEAFVGMDEQIYGPFDKEDVAMIPIHNAKVWLRNGTVSRIVPEERKESD